MKRLYYLTPSLESADTIAKDLREEGIKDEYFYVLSQDERALYERHLHAAGVLQRTDIIRFVERALIVGGMMALCFTLPLNYIKEFTFNVWISVSVFCILISLLSGIVGGLAQENYRIQRYHDAIEQGQLLLMIDVDNKEEASVRSMMSRHHPEAAMQGFSSIWANPFTPTQDMAPIRH